MQTHGTTELFSVTLITLRKFKASTKTIINNDWTLVIEEFNFLGYIYNMSEEINISHVRCFHFTHIGATHVSMAS